MAFEGIDVDPAERLAVQLGQHARTLEAINAQITHLAGDLARYWHGPASAAFQQDWESRHRAALSNAGHAISDMHDHLRANIQDQQRASAAYGGASAGGALDRAQAVNSGVSEVTTPMDKIHELAGHNDVTGRYHSGWTHFKNAAGDPSFLHYKKSPVLHALLDSSHVRAADEILTEGHVPQVLDKAGPAMTGVSLGLDGRRPPATLPRVTAARSSATSSIPLPTP